VPIVARVVRAAVLATKAEVYVERARGGATARRLVLRHIVPNCVTPLLVQASVLMAIAILVEAALLSFPGVGVRPPAPSLGLMPDGRSSCCDAVGGRLSRARDPARRTGPNMPPTACATGSTRAGSGR
jgi:peptide/nickel transport system permease protein